MVLIDPHTQQFTVHSTLHQTWKNRAKLDVLKQTNGRAYSALRLLKSSIDMLQLQMDKQTYMAAYKGTQAQMKPQKTILEQLEDHHQETLCAPGFGTMRLQEWR